MHTTCTANNSLNIFGVVFIALALVDADKQHYNAVTVIPWPIIVGCDRELIHIENGYGTVSM